MIQSNPYNYNMPVKPEMFYGRQSELKSLMADLTSMPGDSCALIGGRRIGKTSLLEYLLNSLEQLGDKSSRIIIPIFITLSGSGIQSPHSFFQSIMSNVHFGLTSTLTLKPAQFTEAYPSAPAFEDLLLIWNQEAISEFSRQIRLVVLLDECEHAVNEQWATELYAALRYLLTGRKSRDLIKVIMSGGYEFLNKVREEGSPLRNILKYYTLHSLDIESTTQLITGPTSSLIPQLATREIINQSGCHPFLTQYIMYQLWENGLENSSVNDIRALAQNFSHERNDFQDWLATLGQTAIQIYQMLVEISLPLSSAELRARFLETPEDFSKSIEALYFHGLIINEEGNYRINGRLFKYWFKENYLGLHKDEISRAFKEIMSKVSSMPLGANRNKAINVLKNIENEIRLGQKANEQKTKKLLDFLSTTAPDAWDVAVKTLSNPVQGVAMVIKKVAERAKIEQKK